MGENKFESSKDFYFYLFVISLFVLFYLTQFSFFFFLGYPNPREGIFAQELGYCFSYLYP